MEADLQLLNAIGGDFNVLEDIIRIPKRYIRDAENPLEWYSNEEFKMRCCFTKNPVTDSIYPLVDWPQIINNWGRPIPPMLMLLATLRFYATGNFQVVCGDLRGISQPSVCRTVYKVSMNLASHCQRYVHFPRTEDEFVDTRQQFYNIAHFPDVTGCIDCTHVPIKSLGGEFAEVFRNRKRTFSINVQVVGGPKLQIFDIVARWPGREHDSVIFNNSSAKTKFEQGVVRGYLLGDSGYPCLPYLMTQLQNPNTNAENRYNRAQIRTRNTVKRLFGVWKRRFPCLSRCLGNKPERCCTIIVACAVLYNIGLIENDDFVGDYFENNENVDVPVFAALVNGFGFGIRRALIQRHFNDL